MARQANDGRGRLGGRAKGTPNKPQDINEWVNTFIKRNRAQFEDDFKTLNAQERAAVMATLIASTGTVPTSIAQPA
jgi:hypothetical protein